MKDTFDASYLCGGIRLSYGGEIGPANYCHREDCRRANGSAFNIGVQVERGQLKVAYATKLRVYRYRSQNGNETERYFCGTCGSPIFTLHPSLPAYAWVKAGIIDDPLVVKPVYENWIKDKVEWVIITVAEGHEESRTP